MRVTVRLPDELHHRLAARASESGASLNQTIVAALHDALSRTAHDGSSGDALLEQVQHVRVALGDVIVELDESALPPALRPGDDLPDADTLRQSMPHLVPPLSATIIAEREDRV